jgi:hypothetical protein
VGERRQAHVGHVVEPQVERAERGASPRRPNRVGWAVPVATVVVVAASMCARVEERRRSPGEGGGERGGAGVAQTAAPQVEVKQRAGRSHQPADRLHLWKDWVWSTFTAWRGGEETMGIHGQ